MPSTQEQKGRRRRTQTQILSNTAAVRILMNSTYPNADSTHILSHPNGGERLSLGLLRKRGRGGSKDLNEEEDPKSLNDIKQMIINDY